MTSDPLTGDYLSQIRGRDAEECEQAGQTECSVPIHFREGRQR
jgi:hypothetical protein